MRTRLILIRHGETIYNAEDRVQGQTDALLSPRGVEQARRLGLRLKDLGAVAAYSSDLSRSLETARAALNGAALKVQLRPALRERAFGHWEGLLWKEVRGRFPEEVERFLKDTVNFAPPGAEPWLDMQARAFKEIDAIAQAHAGEAVLIFTHGGPVKAVVLRALGLAPELWLRISTANGSLSTLENKDGTWRLVGFNDICHLDGDSRDSLSSRVGAREKEEPIA